MQNPYAPDEPSSTIFSEEMWLQGALLSNIAYGVELTLFAMCFRLLVRGFSATNRRRTLCFLAFITSLFVMGTLFMAANSIFTQVAFVQNRNYPGGPSAYETHMCSVPIDEIGNGCFVLSNWLMDLLLVWRCMVIYKGCGSFSWVIMILPSLLFAASVALGTLYVVITATPLPLGVPITLASFSTTLAYFSATLALNVIVTLLIVSRLLLQRRRTARHLGSGHSSHYTSLIAMVVESAALYSIFAVLFIVPFALGSSLAQFFMQSMVQVQTISSFLIIFRVAQGKAWTEKTVIRTSGVVRNSSSMVKMSRLIFAPTKTTLSDVQHPNVSPEATSMDEEFSGEIIRFGENPDLYV